MGTQGKGTPTDRIILFGFNGFEMLAKIRQTLHLINGKRSQLAAEREAAHNVPFISWVCSGTVPEMS